jgi:hypothetical protein
VESNVRFYRRRANEELAAANRALTPAARDRRMQLADSFLERLRAVEAADSAMFHWAETSAVHHA